MIINNISRDALINKEYLKKEWLDIELINRNNDEEIINVKLNNDLITFMKNICLVYGEDYKF
jgi:hypothetical protein